MWKSKEAPKKKREVVKLEPGNGKEKPKQKRLTGQKGRNLAARAEEEFYLRVKAGASRSWST